MTTNEIIKNLDILIKDHENDVYTPFETRWIEVIKMCRNEIADQEEEIKRLTKSINILHNEKKEEEESIDTREIDVPFNASNYIYREENY